MDTSEVMKRVAETVAREQESLVAHFIMANPQIPLERIEVCNGMVEEGGHSIYRVWVREKKDAR